MFKQTTRPTRDTPVLLLSSLLGCALTCALVAISLGGVAAQAANEAIEKPGKSGSEAGEFPLLSEDAAVGTIDKLIRSTWEAKDLKPSKEAEELVWVRRLYLDMIGRIPTLEEIRRYEAMDKNKRRSEILEVLLNEPEFAEYWSGLYLNALISTGGQAAREGVPQLRNWLAESFQDNRPWDSMVFQMLSFSGEVDNADRDDASAGGYLLALNRDLSVLTGNVSRGFLGIELQCVQCHDDKMVDPDEGGYLQQDFRSMAAIFALTRADRKDRNPTDQYYNTYVVRDQPYRKINPDGRAARRMRENAGVNPEVDERLAIRAAVPKAVNGPEVAGTNGLELRRAFATWLTSKENPYFAKAAVNRLWGHFLKRGIVEPIDDFSIINEASNPQLLEFLANDFATNNFDFRRMIRLIVRSQAYNLSSETTPRGQNKNDYLAYSRAYVQQLDLTQTFNSILAATQYEKALSRQGRRDIRALRQNILRSFTFNSDDDESKVKESFSGTIPQALLAMNGDFLNNAVALQAGSTLYTVLKTHKDPKDRVEQLYLATLTRRPSSTESRRMIKFLESEGGTVAAYEDLFWSLLNSAEFLINH